MSLATVIVLLQAVLGLLSNPNLTPTQQMQASQMATQVISLASDALAQPASTPLGVAPTSSYSVSLPASTDNSQPIVVTVNPPVQQPVQQPIQQIQQGIVAQVEQIQVQNSCSLSANTPLDSHGDGIGPGKITWSSQGSVGSGTLYDNYRGKYDGGVIQWDAIGTVEPNGSMDSLNPSFTSAKLVFSDGTTCYSTSTHN